MKFKKVEISAFRIYDRAEDATFDFSYQNGAADFVAIYAPNGFGKTSFYDAVEWAVTNNIHRFWQDRDLTERSIDALRDVTSAQLKLWRNTNALQETYVNIETDQTEHFNRQLSVHGNSKSDVSSEDDVVNKDFRQVILSQEWISAFLKEVNGARRYEIFMENPDLREISVYYSNLKSVVALASEKIASLKYGISEKQALLISSSEGNILETLNAQIAKLKSEHRIELTSLSLSSTQEDVIKLKHDISSKAVSMDKSVEIQEKLDLISKARAGSASNASLDAYESAVTNRPLLDTEIEILTTRLRRFEELSSLRTELRNVTLSHQKRSIEAEEFLKIVEAYPRYLEIKNLLTATSARINAKEKDIGPAQQLSNEAEQLVESKKEELEQVGQQLQRAQSDLVKIPGQRIEIQKLMAEILSSEVSAKSVDEVIHNSKVLIDAAQDQISDFEKLIEMLDKEGGIVYSEDENIRIRYAAISDKREQVSQLNSSISDLEKKINAQEELNSSLERFIQTGFHIVNESKVSACPLCEQQYESFSDLANRISNNQALTQVVQELLAQKKDLSSQVHALQQLINEDIAVIRNFFRVKITSLREHLIELNSLEVENQKKLNGINAVITTAKTKLASSTREMRGLSVDDFEAGLNTSLQFLAQDRERRTTSLVEAEKSLSEAKTKLAAEKIALRILSEEFEQLSNNDKFLLVNNWLKDNVTIQPSDLATVQKMQTEISNEKDNLSALLIDLNNKIKSIESDLKTYTAEDTRKQLERQESNKNDLNSLILNYQYLLIDKLNIKSSDHPTKDFLDRLENDLKTSLRASTELRDQFSILKKYGENVIPYLQSENVKKQISELELALAELTDNVLPVLNDEREKTKQFLQQKVQDFFYTNLINKIYNKIDPHPDFKSVEFKVDFDSETPTLDIFVVNKNDEERIIPNLYFSTAQINILSLSIFLASALNAQKYQSIFIDDPIQSMDSINVLSTIDLLRSIIVNENRQIILSTHDHNFYSLLKKKIPAQLYKSKFIELETFGKVKREILT